ncbi:uncharacterized protein LOC114679488 [Macaca mulatta]
MVGGQAEACLTSQTVQQPGRGVPHFPDGGWSGRGVPHFPDSAAARQRRASLPRWWAEALLTSQTVQQPGRGVPHFPDGGWPGRGAPHFPDGAAARQRRTSLPRWWMVGGQAEACLTSQMVGGQAEALLTSQMGQQPGRDAPHFPDGAGQRYASLPRWWDSWAEALLTSQMGQGPGRSAPHFPEGGRPSRKASHFPDGIGAWQRRSPLPRTILYEFHKGLNVQLKPASDDLVIYNLSSSQTVCFYCVF